VRVYVTQGGVAVPGARVELTRDSGQTVVKQAVADADGVVYFLNLEPGEYEAWAFHPASDRPGRSPVSTSAGVMAEAVVELTTDAQMGTLKIHGFIEGTSPRAQVGFRSRFTRTRTGRAGSTHVTLDSEGEATVAVPAAGGAIAGDQPYGLGWENWTELPAGVNWM